MAAILGWFTYFSIPLNYTLESLSAKRFLALNSGIFRFSAGLETKRFNNSLHIFLSYEVIVSSSTKLIFSLGLVLSESKGLTVLQNCL